MTFFQHAWRIAVIIIATLIGIGIAFVVQIGSHQSFDRMMPAYFIMVLILGGGAWLWCYLEDCGCGGGPGTGRMGCGGW
jgi:preprotein translocase subunit SecY